MDIRPYANEIDIAAKLSAVGDAITNTVTDVNISGVSENVKKFVGKGKPFLGVAGQVINVLGGYEKGQEVAAEHATGDVKHDSEVYNGSVVGGIIGSVGGGLLGGAGGSYVGGLIGTAICPGIGTVIGGALGGAIAGYEGSSKGSEIGSEVGAKIGENRYKDQQFEEMKKQMGPTPDVNMAQVFNSVAW